MIGRSMFGRCRVARCMVGRSIVDNLDCLDSGHVGDERVVLNTGRHVRGWKDKAPLAYDDAS